MMGDKSQSDIGLEEVVSTVRAAIITQAEGDGASAGRTVGTKQASPALVTIGRLWSTRILIGSSVLGLVLGMAIGSFVYAYLHGEFGLSYSLYFERGIAPVASISHQSPLPAAVGAVSFYDLPSTIFPLPGTTDSRRTRYAKVSVSVELNNPADYSVIAAYEPRIRHVVGSIVRDNFASHYKESGGVEALRINLLDGINKAIAPQAIKDVVIPDFIISD